MEDGNVGKIWHKNPISDKSHKSAVAMVSAQFSRCVFPENVYSSKPAKQIQIQATKFILSQLVNYLMDVVSLCAQNTNRTKFLEARAEIMKCFPKVTKNLCTFFFSSRPGLTSYF